MQPVTGDRSGSVSAFHSPPVPTQSPEAETSQPPVTAAKPAAAAK